MEREMIRKAEKKDISRIAEILVFDKRIKYRPIFKDDAYCFGKAADPCRFRAIWCI